MHGAHRIAGQASAALAAAAAALLMIAAAPQARAQAAPKPTAEAVWQHLQQQEFRKSFRLFPGTQQFYKGQDPHGALLTTYVNATAFDALSKRARTLPDGAIIVKENYMPDKTLAATTVMYKSKGYNPAANDWFWLKRSARGEVEAAGKADGCIDCHRPSQRDFILTPVK
jgi:hypothetical protein